ncbi:MAG: hypothetical protein ACM3YN_13960 [Parcubacteria group bacterium]
MNFIKACSGKLYPAGRIRSIGEPVTRRSCGITDVEIDGLGEVECYTHEVDSFLKRPVTAFAAQPDTYILRADEESPGGYWRMLVIAWGSAGNGRLYPITIDGANDGTDEDHAILTPDGRVTEIDGASWESVDQWLAHERQMLLAAA